MAGDYELEPNSNNFGALSQRVTGLENSVAQLSSQFSNQIDNLSRSVSNQIRDLSSEIKKQSSDFANSRSTNWSSFWSSAAAVGAVIVALGAAIITPLYGRIGEAELEAKQYPYLYENSKYADEQFTIFRNRFSKDEQTIVDLAKDSVSKREVDELEKNLKERIDDLKSSLAKTNEESLHQVHTLEGEIVTRPENEAHWAEISERISDAIKRLDALSARLNNYGEKK